MSSLVEPDGGRRKGKYHRPYPPPRFEKKKENQLFSPLGRGGSEGRKKERGKKNGPLLLSPRPERKGEKEKDFLLVDGGGRKKGGGERSGGILLNFQSCWERIKEKKRK